MVLMRDDHKIGAASGLTVFGGQRKATIAPGELRFTFARSGGPGGQAVNKINTKAVLRVAIASIQGLDEGDLHRLRALAGRRMTQDDEIVIAAETHRSQSDNKHECLARLRDLVAAALTRPKVRRKKKPTRSMIEKRLASKRRSSEKKMSRRGRKLRGDDND